MSAWLVSPYHVTTREAPALAAMLLAGQVITFLPAPAGMVDADHLAKTVHKVPRYLRFMESWSWSRPLWESGAVAAAYEGSDAAAEVRRVHERIECDPSLAELRLFMRAGVLDDEESYLHAIATDVLKGGPDPALSVPVAAGLDRFAARRGLIVARSQPHSMAQRAETAISRPLFALALPVLLQGTGERLSLARELLRDELTALRDAIDDEIAAAERAARARKVTTPARRGASPKLRQAAAEYAAAFEAIVSRLTEPERDEIRTIPGAVTLSAVRIPANAVLESSLCAARTARKGTGRRPAPDERLPVLRDDAADLSLVSFIVKAAGAPEMARR